MGSFSKQVTGIVGYEAREGLGCIASVRGFRAWGFRVRGFGCRW